MTIVFLSVATWYGDAHEGKTMANGQPFYKDDLTCATYLFDIGTELEVSYEGKSVFVVVTDRCDNKTDIDLSEAAFKAICPLEEGRIEVKVTYNYDDQLKLQEW